jgi:hypothetical protein
VIQTDKNINVKQAQSRCILSGERPEIRKVEMVLLNHRKRVKKSQVNTVIQKKKVFFFLEKRAPGQFVFYVNSIEIPFIKKKLHSEFWPDQKKKKFTKLPLKCES